MAVHSAGAAKIWPGAGAATNGFIVLIVFIAIDKVIHCALRAGNHSQSAVKCVRDRLAYFGVAGYHGSGMAGVDHRAVWDANIKWFQAAFVHRYIGADKSAKDI